MLYDFLYRLVIHRRYERDTQRGRSSMGAVRECGISKWGSEVECR
jgi:hypothetical protein